MATTVSYTHLDVYKRQAHTDVISHERVLFRVQRSYGLDGIHVFEHDAAYNVGAIFLYFRDYGVIVHR